MMVLIVMDGLQAGHVTIKTIIIEILIFLDLSRKLLRCV